MRVAVIADIHGNLQALEAVMDNFDQWSPDLILVGGDIIGLGPDSLGVLDLLKTLNHVAVVGNSDERVLNAFDLSLKTVHHIR